MIEGMISIPIVHIGNSFDVPHGLDDIRGSITIIFGLVIVERQAGVAPGEPVVFKNYTYSAIALDNAVNVLVAYIVIFKPGVRFVVKIGLNTHMGKNNRPFSGTRLVNSKNIISYFRCGMGKVHNNTDIQHYVHNRLANVTQTKIIGVR